MSLLSEFREFLRTDIEVYSLGTVASAWGTGEKTYPATATKTITGYIQPTGGSKAFKNQSNEIEITHILYCYATETFNDTDMIVDGSESYIITDNPPRGVGGIFDHKEVGLKRERSSS